ncbi:hypothetical protein [Cytophaga aurantiaca]|uniref:hypothetical protein n=1 Tax=Cytophaga aurantiaca TaxID=29530 RepID=UPI000374CCB2|nr:hypothetical protein [Cytophaga aurantiaca]
MKITHSFIVLTSLVFITGSMLTVAMDLKATTDNVYTNVVQAKQKYVEKMQVDHAEKQIQKTSKESDINQAKTLYKIKLESLNQSHTAKSTKYFPGKRG